MFSTYLFITHEARTFSMQEVHPSGLDSALGHGLDSIAAPENNSCDAGVRCALPPVPRSTLLRLMPDPRPTVDAFTLAYQYFRKVCTVVMI